MWAVFPAALESEQHRTFWSSRPGSGFAFRSAELQEFSSIWYQYVYTQPTGKVPLLTTLLSPVVS